MAEPVTLFGLASAALVSVGAGFTALWRRQTTLTDRTEARFAEKEKELLKKLDDCEEKHAGQQATSHTLDVRLARVEGRQDACVEIGQRLEELPDRIAERLQKDAPE